MLFSDETMYPGRYRGDFSGIDDEKWSFFSVSRINPETGQWKFENVP